MSEPRFLECRLPAGAGTTMREAHVALVPGHAITGPTRFPVLVPHIMAGEHADWTRDGWVIRTQKKKPRP